MEIAVVGATAAVTLEGDTVARARVAITALAPTIRRVPEAEAALEGRADDDGCRRGRPPRPSAPISDVRASDRYRRRWPRSSPGARSRRLWHVPAAATFRSPRAGARREDPRLSVNGMAYPVDVEPGTSLLAAVRRRRRADRRQGGMRRFRMRRLHDAARREAAEQLLVPRAAGRGQQDHDRRGARER